MNAPSAARLYTPELLGLAVSLADYPLTDDLSLFSDVRSRTCGSTLSLGLRCDDAGRIEKLGMMVSACAVGQAAAAIFAADARGMNATEIDGAADAIESWLSGRAPRPDWQGLGVLEPAREFPGRHDVIALPWKAARDALCNIAPQG